MFSLFIYTVGYISGPQFFYSLNKTALKEIGMALFLSATALATVLVLARWFHLDQGTAAGLAAGGLTQSSIIGTAGDAIVRLALPAAQITTMQTSVAVGYAATYIFGVIGAILVCVFLLPKSMGVTLKGEAIRAEAKLGASQPLAGCQRSAFSVMTRRSFRVEAAAGKTIAMIEAAMQGGAGVITGSETDALKDPALVVESRDVLFTRKGANGLTLVKLRDQLGALARHGVFTSGIARMNCRCRCCRAGATQPVTDKLLIERSATSFRFSSESAMPLCKYL